LLPLDLPINLLSYFGEIMSWAKLGKIIDTAGHGKMKEPTGIKP
jgi:hypothetical protein|tara:strand:- start:270 stop:401 length:132 start_codon:yes stop_codon:yes gene_type:complete